MLVRLLFLLLLALNLGAGAWLLFAPVAVRSWPPRSAAGVTSLRLLSELPAAPAPAVAVAGTTAAPAPAQCSSLGPFSTAADMRAAMQALTPRVARIQYREEQTRRSHGYWVYLPATPTREAALDAARQLAGRGVRDYYIVTAGDLQNTISLGLFNDQANAQQRLAEIQRLGFKPQLEQRVEAESSYWLDFAVAAASGFDWHQALPGRSDLAARPIDCF